MKLGDILPIVATLLGAIVSFYFALVSGDYVIAIVVGIPLPTIGLFITWVINGSKILIVAALIVGFIAVGIAILVRWQEQNTLDFTLNTIASRNKIYSERTYPPLPIGVPNGGIIYSDYLSVFLRNKPTLAFLAAPAGAGKSVLLQQMVGSSNNKTQAGTVYLPLGKIQEKPSESRKPDAYGTQQGLGRVSTIEAADSEAAGIFTVICLSQFQLHEVSEQITKQWPFWLRSPEANRRRFADACRQRLERETETSEGLRVFIDDVDEIEESSLLKLMSLVEKAITNVPSSPRRKLLFLLAGRPEVFYTTSKERRSLWAESRDPSSNFSLLTGTIERMTPNTTFYQAYLSNCVRFSLEGKDEQTLGAVLAAINSQHTGSTNLHESLEYLDGCGFAAKHFLRLREEHKPFNDIIFGQDFYYDWRNRAYEKHRLPSVDQANEYENMLKEAAGELAKGGGEAKLHLGLRVLMYSGLVDIIPVNFGNRDYRVKFQFPQFMQAILRPAWEQRNQPARRHTRT